MFPLPPWSLVLILLAPPWTESQAYRQFFIREPDNQTAIQGTQVTLPCQVENKEGFLQWTRDGFGLGETRDLPGYSRYRLIGSDEEKDWTLQIQPVLLEDDAIFQCQVGAADEILPIRSRFAKVTVYVPPADPIILQGDVYSTKEGSRAQLICVSPGGKPAADILWYDGFGDMIIDNIDMRTTRLEDGKRFNTTSILSFTPSKKNHNQTFTCSASNVADRSRRKVTVQLLVEYAPSVNLITSRDKLMEGDTATFNCQSHGNPAPVSYAWFVNGEPIQGFVNNFFIISNISRVYHSSIIKCRVENRIGISEESILVNVLYEPEVVLNPLTEAGEKGDTVTLHCLIDSNPPPVYTWTRGQSRQAVGSSQNLSVIVSGRTEGEYYCHGIAEGFDLVTTHPAKILVMGSPTILTSKVQEGVEGDNVRVLCGGVSVPPTTGVIWSYMGTDLHTESEKYEVMTSHEVEYGFTSTLLIKNAESIDFGDYGCAVANRLGADEQSILLNKKDNVPVLMLMTIILSSLAIVLLIVCIVLYVRRTGTKGGQLSEKPAKPNNIRRTPSPDCGEWTTCNDDLYNQQLRQEKLPDVQPKPDLISNGYVPYGSYVRDYPQFPASESQTSLQSAGHLNYRNSALLIKHPRYSAAYGNPHLSTPACLPQYSTFTPPGYSSPVLAERIGLERLTSQDNDRQSQSPGLDSGRMTNSPGLDSTVLTNSPGLGLGGRMAAIGGDHMSGSVIGIGLHQYPVSSDLYAVVNKPNSFSPRANESTGFSARANENTGFSPRANENTGFSPRANENTGFISRSIDNGGFNVRATNDSPGLRSNESSAFLPKTNGSPDLDSESNNPTNHYIALGNSADVGTHV